MLKGHFRGWIRSLSLCSYRLEMDEKNVKVYFMKDILHICFFCQHFSLKQRSNYIKIFLGTIGSTADVPKPYLP